MQDFDNGGIPDQASWLYYLRDDSDISGIGWRSATAEPMMLVRVRAFSEQQRVSSRQHESGLQAVRIGTGPHNAARIVVVPESFAVPAKDHRTLSERIL